MPIILAVALDRAQIDAVSRLIQLTSRDRRLLLWTALLIIGTRLALSVLPFRVVLKALRALSRSTLSVRVLAATSIERALWAVEVCTNRLGLARTCLIRAMVAHTLLLSTRNAATLRIGVAKDRGGKLQAHAWVESNGRVVIGRASEVFVPLR